MGDQSTEPHSSARTTTEVTDALRSALADADALVTQLRLKLEEAEAARAKAVEAATSAQEKLAEVVSTASAALAAKAQVADEQAVIAKKSEHIQSAQEHADRVRADLDRQLTAATQQATEAEGQRTRAQTASDSAAEVLATIRAHKATAETDAGTAAESRDAAKAAAATSKALADKSEVIEARIADYEKTLADLAARSKEQLAEITGLLPGATAAGLAHAFDDRRQTFLKPATRWQWLFVGSLLSLVVLALTGLWNAYSGNTPLGWDDLARVWLARLPIAGALVWLALHSSREAALAKRLEEDYGYKAAVAASFQGFQKQMAELGTAAPEGTPLAKLCGDTLSTIASPPGRIYEKHHLTVTPARELADAATKVVGTDKSKP